MTSYHLHLVSDATGETISSVTRACLVQFSGIEPVEHVWSLVRTRSQMDRVVAGVQKYPGPVLFTLVNEELRTKLVDGTRELGVPTIPVLDGVIHALAGYFGLPISGKPGLQHVMDTEYFERIEAMNYTLSHDDGQSTAQLQDADVILIGVSRTSKTPTCIYLANRGIKAANIPYVPGIPLPQELFRLDGPLVVGLTKDAQSLVQVRRQRLNMLDEHAGDTDYVDPEKVREEVQEARRLFARKGWPTIDVSRRSIEETAATIMTYYSRHRAQEVG